jgi:hypothetical protein
MAIDPEPLPGVLHLGVRRCVRSGIERAGSQTTPTVSEIAAGQWGSPPLKRRAHP